MLARGDALGAIALANRFLREHPGHGRASALKARGLVAIGDADAAIDLFERVGAEDARDFHAWAKALLQQEKWSTAEPLLQHVLASGIDRPDVLHELAACRAKLGDYAGAVSAAEEFSREPGFAARGHLLLGTIHQERGNLQRAAEAWGEVVKIDPEAKGLQVASAPFFLEYGSVLTTLGEPEKAVDLLQRSLALESGADTLVALGDAYSQLGRTKDAEDSYRRALELNPAEINARKGLAELALTQGDADQALTWLTPIESASRMTSQLAYLFQRTYTRLSDPEAAERWRIKADDLRHQERIADTARQILQNAPESDWARIIRAYRFAEAGNWEEAEHILRPLATAAKDQPFIQSLIDAVRTRGTLPSLDGIPLRQF
jgi:tetratricopeptide (TPR) repeat protein